MRGDTVADAFIFQEIMHLGNGIFNRHGDVFLAISGAAPVPP